MCHTLVQKERCVLALLFQESPTSRDPFIEVPLSYILPAHSFMERRLYFVSLVIFNQNSSDDIQTWDREQHLSVVALPASSRCDTASAGPSLPHPTVEDLGILLGMMLKFSCKCFG